MARLLRSSRVALPSEQITNDEQDEDSEASNNENDEISTPKRGAEQQQEHGNLDTPATGFLRRMSGFLFGGTVRSSRVSDRPDAGELKSSTLVDGVEELMDANKKDPVQLSIAVAEEEQQQDPEGLPSVPELESIAMGGSEAMETSSQPTAERAISVVMPRLPNSALNKLNRSKQPVYDDNSFQYSKPKDIYDMSSDSEKEETSPKTEQAAERGVQTAKKKNIKASKKNPPKKKAHVAKGDDKLLEVEDSVSTRRRGRPPKVPRQRKTDEVSVGAEELSNLQDPEVLNKEDAGGISDGNPRGSIPETRSRRGRPKSIQNSEKQTTSPDSRSERDNHPKPTTEPAAPVRNQESDTVLNESPRLRETEKSQELTHDHSGRTIETDGKEYHSREEHDQPATRKPIPRSSTKVSKKRTNAHLPASGTSRKRAKTTDTVFEPDEDSYEAEIPSSEPQSEVAPQPKPRSLVLEVAAAEEYARKKGEEVRLKERELQIAKRHAEDAERAAGRWRGRLAIARERALAQEREAKGLPPLKTRRDIVDLSSEEDFQDGVERISGVFGTNNLSQVTSVPFSNEEREQLVRGLWDERKTGAKRFYKIYKLPVFRKNNRSFDDILAKIVEFKRDMMFDWERKRLVDANIGPLDDWIMSIPDKPDK